LNIYLASFGDINSALAVWY